MDNATLYRHFPARDALLVAVYTAEVEALTDAARELLETTQNGHGLKAWLRVIIDHSTARRGPAPASLYTVGERKNLVCRWHDPLVATTTELITDGREHGAAHGDVRPAELLMMAYPIAAVAESTPDVGEPLLDIAFDRITPC
ncbi:TetR/AcrR family transcriptional regulator [Streptomyces sp. NPDC057253]|uniref:TetR/AcrR family transcriptional regulator n=1 Tax=Streptomyces sp. NPDC057253 TaxID=3346069 RepID=UPI0036328C46